MIALGVANFETRTLARISHTAIGEGLSLARERVLPRARRQNLVLTSILGVRARPLGFGGAAVRVLGLCVIWFGGVPPAAASRAWLGKDEAMASLMWRTETRTDAPIEGWIKRREWWFLPDPPKLSWSL